MGIKAVAAAAVGGGLLSAIGLTAIMQHEGLRTTAYPDPATGGHPWTICYGHTGRDVYPGLTVDKTQCERWLREDLRASEDAVRRHITVPLRQGQYDSYVSFVFNVGEGAFARSTMVRLTNQGQWQAACNQFPRWKYANNIVLEGIVRRRVAEQRMCLEAGPYVFYPDR